MSPFLFGVQMTSILRMFYDIAQGDAVGSAFSFAVASVAGIAGMAWSLYQYKKALDKESDTQ
jgi:hypothetical protein